MGIDRLMSVKGGEQHFPPVTFVPLENVTEKASLLDRHCIDTIISESGLKLLKLLSIFNLYSLFIYLITVYSLPFQYSCFLCIIRSSGFLLS